MYSLEELIRCLSNLEGVSRCKVQNRVDVRYHLQWTLKRVLKKRIPGLVNAWTNAGLLVARHCQRELFLKLRIWRCTLYGALSEKTKNPRIQ
nr:hypothetical protein Iba_chr04aCG3520 [Ipomoea batatas]